MGGRDGVMGGRDGGTGEGTRPYREEHGGAGPADWEERVELKNRNSNEYLRSFAGVKRVHRDARDQKREAFFPPGKREGKACSRPSVGPITHTP